VNVVVCARWEPKKFNVPNSGKDESNDDNTLGKFWGAKKLTNCKQVCGGRKRQRGHEVRATSISEVARADGERHEQNGGEYVQFLLRGELHSFPVPIR
jgi:hypothetical protein